MVLTAIRYIRLPNLLVINNWVYIESRDSVGMMSEGMIRFEKLAKEQKTQTAKGKTG